MNNQQFFAERDALLKVMLNKAPKVSKQICPALMDKYGCRPTKDFIKKFYARMPSDEKCDKEGFHGDGIDYVRWGYALWDDWEEDEDTPSLLCLFDWATYYGI